MLGIPTQGESDFRKLRKRAREARKRDGVQTGKARRSHPADSEPQRDESEKQRYELGVSLSGKFGRGVLVVGVGASQFHVDLEASRYVRFRESEQLLGLVVARAIQHMDI